MCGIVGVVCKSHFGFSQKQVDLFEQLLRADELRGDDATGIIYVTNDTGFGILKEASPASWSASTMLHDELLKDKIRKGKALIGHNRKATVGRITDETSHPFVVDNKFAMVHNGTLRGHKKLKDTEVDSEALAHVFADALKKGIEQEKLEEKVGSVEGAFATASYQQDENRVYLLRNNERPLYFLELSDCFVWGSEAGMVLWIAGRNGYDLTKTNGFVLKDHMMMSIDLSNNSLDFREFVPKRATPPVATMATGGNLLAKTSAAVRTEGGLSKQQFKRIKRQFMGRRQSFFVDDWVETTFPQQELSDGADSILLLGEFDGTAFSGLPHQVRTTIKVSELFTDKVPDDFRDEMYSGAIVDVYNNTVTGQVEFWVDNVKVIQRSVDIKEATKNLIGKWSALPAPEPVTPEGHPDLMDTATWQKANQAFRYDYTIGKWVKRENSTTLH